MKMGGDHKIGGLKKISVTSPEAHIYVGMDDILKENQQHAIP